MSWFRQVLHVVRKDVLMSRWLLLAFSALAVVGALSTAAGVRSASIWAAVVLPLAGMLITAFLVQADSPVRADSFLATRPLHPFAVWAAKVVLPALLFLTAAALVHVSVVLAWGGVGSGFLVHAASAGLAVAPWLGVALLVALLTPDLRSFVTGLLVLFVVYVTGSLLALRAGSGTDGWVLADWVLVPGVLLLGANQYRTRRLAPGVVLGALIFVSAWAAPPLGLWAGGSVVPMESRATLRVAEFRPAERMASPVRAGDGPERGQLAMPLVLVFEGGRPGLQYGARVMAAALLHADGTRQSVIRANTELLSRWRPALVTDEFAWFGEAGPTRLEAVGSDTATITLWVTDEQARALGDGKASVEVRLSLEVWDVGPGVRLPLQAGATAAAGGVRYHVADVGSAQFLTLETASVTPSISARSRDGDRPVPAVLIRPDLGMAMALQRGNAGSVRSSIFGLDMHEGTAALVPAVSGEADAHREWLTGAELVVGARRYVGSYAVRISTSGAGQASAY